ncbi:caspase family protein [Thalassotalea sp. LPB0316]|uniref:caspase family protein n=1 Tax=Thalassotalea sp. LPB0316 TaxID=2769490 RepID=UPI00186625F5|nr:caspase family protein [Thalassotalea sp. LPB0316]QOL25656.1 caspase family protein [Thalassotalea sp. LPB0316]
MTKTAILIGSSIYEDNSLHNLRCPESDVTGLVKVFKDKNIGEFDEINTFINKSSHEIIIQIQSKLNQLGNEDTLVIYFSGHGKISITGNLYLTTTNTNTHLLETTAIELALIYRLIKDSNCRKVIVILDCCYSGAVGDVITKGTIEDQIQNVNRGSGTVLLTASTGLQVAIEKETDDYSLFTKYLIQGLKTGEPDLNGDGFITINELYSYAYQQVTNESSQEPTCSGIDIKGDLTIAKSGKQPRKEREKALEKLLFSLKHDKRIGKEMFQEAYSIIGLAVDDLSTEQRTKDNLLTDLLNGDLEAVDLILKWNQIIKPSSSGNNELPPKEKIKTITSTEAVSNGDEERAKFTWWKQILFTICTIVLCSSWEVKEGFYMQLSCLLLVLTLYVSVKYQANLNKPFLVSSPVFLFQYDFYDVQFYLGETLATLLLLIGLNQWILASPSFSRIRERLTNHYFVTVTLIPLASLVLSIGYFFTDDFYLAPFISLTYLLPLFIAIYCTLHNEYSKRISLILSYVCVICLSLALKYFELNLSFDFDNGYIFFGFTTINWFEPLLFICLIWCAINFQRDIHNKQIGLISKYGVCATGCFVLYLLNLSGITPEAYISSLFSEQANTSSIENIEVVKTSLFSHNFSAYWMLLFFIFWGASNSKVKWYIPTLMGIIFYFTMTVFAVIADNTALIDIALLLYVILIFHFSVKYSKIIRKALSPPN